VDRQGQVYAARTISPTDLTTDVTHYRISRYSPNGRLLSQWVTTYGTNLTAAEGFLFGTDEGRYNLAKLAPATGKVLARWDGKAQDIRSFDAVTADPQGTVYLGVTTGDDPPFAIQRLGQRGARFAVSTINTAHEQVDNLAIDPQGNIYVVRASYARPCDSNLGLDKLASSGDVIGTFHSC
jgi:sugar lactone lactonase YvrE